MRNNNIFAERLNALVKKTGISLYKIAEDCNLTSASLYQYLDGTNAPTLYSAAKIADYFGVSLDWLAGRDISSKDKSTVSIETPLGALVARSSGGEPEHPGINIELHRPGITPDLLLTLIEFSNDDGDFPEGEPLIITRAYGEAMEDEYTDRIIHRGIEKYFKTQMGMTQ